MKAKDTLSPSTPKLSSYPSTPEKMRLITAPDYQQHEPFLRQLPQLFAQGQGTVIYQQRNEVRRFEHEGTVMMAKRYKRVNAVQQVVYSTWRRTKACRAFLFAQEFRRRGIDTPHEIAYIETTNALGLFTVGYFVSSFVEGTETSLLLREVQDYPRDLADAVAAHVVLMHSRGVLHGDLNLSNFLCRREDGAYRFSVIDINRSHFTTGMPTDEQCLQNMVRITHRRDLYDYLIRSYARQRGWDPSATSARALALLDAFEHRRFKL